jgi:serine/threonine-protein kinase
VPGDYLIPRFSPDGKRLAVTAIEGNNWDVWVYEWERDTMSRLTFTAGIDRWPVWAPNGKHIAFQSDRAGGASNIYWMRADGAGETVRLTESKNPQIPYSISADGKRLAFYEIGPETNADLWTLPLDLSDPDRPKPGKPELFLRTPFTEVYPAFSPDGHWIAYGSDESGASEVYVRPFPGPGGKWQVSTGGGTMPVWSRNGRELFYRAGSGQNRIMVANYTAKGDAFVADKPRLWSEKQFGVTANYANFDLAPDGKRFAVLMTPEGEGEKAPSHLNFLLSFFDELRRRVK